VNIDITGSHGLAPQEALHQRAVMCCAIFLVDR